ncbi:THAP5 protein, partial [Probosciger aterrimus]|nr:THAP5 protein [Probosciger aterrimus]
MPRYCAASTCKNRGGQSARDRTKLSFYPFPLHDKERLEKWLRNMKRDAWTPTKHQVLCSDHFTPDSLDVRWGIRYLKHTAVPTIFSSPEDEERDSSRKRSQERKKENPKETNKNVVSEKASVPLKPCTPKKNPVLSENVDEKAEVVCSTALTDPDYLNSSLKNALGSITDYAIENPNSHIVGCSVEVQPTSENTVLLSTVTQTIEQFSGSKESVTAIIVPAESSEEPEIVNSSFLPVEPELLDTEETDTSVYTNAYGGNEVLQNEHSYCKQDIDRDLLWQKISKLHSKITLLEMQEVETLGRLRSLEALVGHLKQENLHSKKKLEIVENSFTTVEVTVLQ